MLQLPTLIRISPVLADWHQNVTQWYYYYHHYRQHPLHQAATTYDSSQPNSPHQLFVYRNSLIQVKITFTSIMSRSIVMSQKVYTDL